MRGTPTRPDPRFCARQLNIPAAPSHESFLIPPFLPPPDSHCYYILATTDLKRLLLVLSPALSPSLEPRRPEECRRRIDSTQDPSWLHHRCCYKPQTTSYNGCLFPSNPRHRLRGGSSNSEAEEAYRYLDFLLFFKEKKEEKEAKQGTKRQEAHHPSPK